MDKFTVFKVCLLTAIVSGFLGAVFTRNHLVNYHKADLEKQDRACMKSVFQATQIAKNHKRKVRNPVYVVEGANKAK